MLGNYYYCKFVLCYILGKLIVQRAISYLKTDINFISLFLQLSSKQCHTCRQTCLGTLWIRPQVFCWVPAPVVSAIIVIIFYLKYKYYIRITIDSFVVGILLTVLKTQFGSARKIVQNSLFLILLYYYFVTVTYFIYVCNSYNNNLLYSYDFFVLHCAR